MDCEERSDERIADTTFYQKYSLDIVMWLMAILAGNGRFLMEYVHRCTEAHFQQPSLLCSNRPWFAYWLFDG